MTFMNHSHYFCDFQNNRCIIVREMSLRELRLFIFCSFGGQVYKYCVLWDEVMGREEGGIYSTKGGVTTRYSMIAGLFSD